VRRATLACVAVVRDHEKRVLRADHVLDGGGLMPVLEDEVRRLRSQRLVLLPRQLDPLRADGGAPLEQKLQVRRALLSAERGDPLVPPVPLRPNKRTDEWWRRLRTGSAA